MSTCSLCHLSPVSTLDPSAKDRCWCWDCFIKEERRLTDESIKRAGERLEKLVKHGT